MLKSNYVLPVLGSVSILLSMPATIPKPFVLLPENALYQNWLKISIGLLICWLCPHVKEVFKTLLDALVIAWTPMKARGTLNVAVSAGSKSVPHTVKITDSKLSTITEKTMCQDEIISASEIASDATVSNSTPNARLASRPTKDERIRKLPKKLQTSVYTVSAFKINAIKKVLNGISKLSWQIAIDKSTQLDQRVADQASKLDGETMMMMLLYCYHSVLSWADNSDEDLTEVYDSAVNKMSRAKIAGTQRLHPDASSLSEQFNNDIDDILLRSAGKTLNGCQEYLDYLSALPANCLRPRDRETLDDLINLFPELHKRSCEFDEEYQQIREDHENLVSFLKWASSNDFVIQYVHCRFALEDLQLWYPEKFENDLDNLYKKCRM